MSIPVTDEVFDESGTAIGATTRYVPDVPMTRAEIMKARKQLRAFFEDKNTPAWAKLVIRYILTQSYTSDETEAEPAIEPAPRED